MLGHRILSGLMAWMMAVGMLWGSVPGERQVEIAWGIPTAEGVSLWKPGTTTSLRIRILREGESAERFTGKIRLTAPDSDGMPIVSEKTVDADLPCEVEMPVRLGLSTAEFSLEIFRGESLFFQQKETLKNPVDAAKKVVLVVGGESMAGVERAVEQLHIPGKMRPLVTHVPTAADLPKSPYSWEIVESIIVLTRREADVEAWDAESLGRLRQWVRQGGFLVLSLGNQTAKMAALEPWKPFFPGVYQKLLPLPQTTALEQFAQSTVPVPLWGVTEEYRIPVAQFSDLAKDVRILASQFDLPIVMQRVWDFGRVTWATMDLEHESLRRWGDVGRWTAKLLEYTDRSADYEERHVAGMHRGYHDMSGQLRSALDQFEGLRVVSFWNLTILFLIYLFLIGPGCYYASRRGKFREMVSWGIFLATVAGGTWLVVWLSQTDSSKPRWNRVSVTDVMADSGYVRQTLWGNLWTPVTGRFHLGVTPSHDYPQTRLEWFGLPGSFLGGMDSTLPVTSAWGELANSCRWEGNRLEPLPLVSRSTKSLTATHWTELSRIAPEKTWNFGHLQERNAVPYGEIHNPLDVPLEHCLLLYGGWAYDLQTLQPGETRKIDDALRRYDVISVLVEAQYIEEKSFKDEIHYRRVHLPYDQTATDLEYIVKTLLFYHSTGGRSYTGLENQYQPTLDGTPLLASGEAILFGRVLEKPENPRLFADFTLDDQIPDDPRDQNVRLIRIFLKTKLF
ncbi:MAG: hypothetical protein Q4E67_06735 [Planctomycetia bacterium]|nr:hypothetical protein [Planctomycetia bacterium]